MVGKPTQKTLRKRQVRLVDVAQTAGVSRWVAGQVLNGGNGNSRASAEAKTRILQVAEELGYRPNHASQLLQGKRSNTFGVLVASAGDPLRSFLVQFLDLEAVKIGYHSLTGIRPNSRR
ncbi:MAG: LacI family transcriptional regulator [bacterium]|nr:LacI family transcriptional regulator [bacterium]